MHPDQAISKAAMERLEPFVGEWSIEARFPEAPPSDIRGRTIFEWVLGGQFLMQSATVPHPDAPDGLMVIGCDAQSGGYLQHYFDSRGIARLYAMSFADGTWTLLREKPDFTPLPFSQRFIGTFSDDGTVIEGRWETSNEGSTWELDFELIYRKVE